MYPTFKTQAGKFEIQVNLLTGHGSFEHEDLGDECAGNLNFELTQNEDLGDPLPHDFVLVDYDGVFALPKVVAAALREAGFVVSSDFD